MRTSILNGLGPALRWLRDRRGKKQYQVASSAGITKGMLSAYETGRQRPSLETLDKILETLQCNLNDLHNSLQIVNGRPGELIRPGDLGAREAAGGGWTAGARGGDGGQESGGPDVYQALRLDERLPADEEHAMTSMLDGFHRLLRFLHQQMPRTSPSASEAPPEGGDGDDNPTDPSDS